MMLRVVRSGVERVTRPPAFDAETMAVAERIVGDVKVRGWEGVAQHSERLGDGAAVVMGRAEMERAASGLDRESWGVLKRTAARIKRFAEAQRACLTDLACDVEGGRAGHRVMPVDRAGCYAPGGRFPLPSSVLMTAVTARVAGVREVWVASPKPTAATVAAAVIAGADGLLCAGGAQAIGALAYGAGGVPACDVIVGPGNRWVTAAKAVVSRDVAIDMLAGPSEVVVLADGTADAEVVAADLLAQAEHDPDAAAIVVTTSEELAACVERELARQLETLPTAAIAREALRNGYVLVARSMEEAIAACDEIAPEHLQVMTEDSRSVAARCKRYGAVFVGGASAEALGDYGMGPNHVLPTGGTARYASGLSVFTFLRVRTWLEAERGSGLGGVAHDAVKLARMEGLEGHARAAGMRR